MSFDNAVSQNIYLKQVCAFSWEMQVFCKSNNRMIAAIFMLKLRKTAGLLLIIIIIIQILLKLLLFHSKTF